MKKYVSLLRGINVSGQKKIKMAELKEMYLVAGFLNVETYIQSGNVVFESNKSDKFEIKTQLEELIKNNFGFDVPVHVLSKQDIDNTFQINPFLERENISINHMGVTFLEHKVDNNIILSISDLSVKGQDEFVAVGKNIFLLLPNGFGRTKLNNNFFEIKLKTTATSRNWKTITKLVEMMK